MSTISGLTSTLPAGAGADYSPSGFVVRPGSGASLHGLEGSWGLRVEVMGIGRFQKEGLVEDRATGRTWRLAADEGTYLGGTGLAPAPLMHWFAGLHGDVLSRIADVFSAAGVELRSLSATISQGFASDGSFVKGEAVARVYDHRIAVRLGAEISQAEAADLVGRALVLSPAMAAMMGVAEGTFGLSVNGRRAAVVGVPASTAPRQEDPFLRHSAPPSPAPGESQAQTLRSTRVGTASAVLSDDQTGAVGWRVEADGTYDVSTGMVESSVGFPEAAEWWDLVSDATGMRAPSGLAYFATGIAFCYHTQLHRYATVRRIQISAPRLVQDMQFSSGPDGALSEPADTQLFLNGVLEDDEAASLLLAAASTCYAHRALSVDIERPVAEVSVEDVSPS